MTRNKGVVATLMTDFQPYALNNRPSCVRNENSHGRVSCYMQGHQSLENYVHNF